MERLDRFLTAGAALLVAGLGFLPIAIWIPGGPSIPTWGDLVAGWWSGTATVAGIAVVAAVLTRNAAGIPGERIPSLLAASYARRPRAWSAVLALVAAGLYLGIGWAIGSGKPLLIDEIAQVFQARIFAGGSLWIPAPAHPEFFSSSLILNLDGKVFSQFPAGAPAMLALGSLAGAEWVVAPLFAAASVALFAALVRELEPRPGVALAATVLFGFSPFVAFMAGSHMNHTTGLTWLLVGMLGLARVVHRGSARFGDGLLLGLGFGIAATVRPSDGLLFAVPAGVWLLMRTLRSRHWPVLAGAGTGIALPMLALFAVNAATTGAALTFGYIALWGASHDVGFHVSPWGELHTPARGLELLNLYFVRLQSYLFETPVPSLLPAIAGLGLARRLSAFDRYLLLTAALVCAFYFAYWHDGFFLGPRFMIPLTPLLALWTARAFALARERFPSRQVARGLAVAVVAAVLMAGLSLSIRARQYRSGMLTMRWDADAAARRAGVAHALVLVRESWGAQLVARMWAAGVPSNEAEHQYRKTDACALEQTLDRIEQEGLRGAAAVAELRPLLRDSARLVPSPFTTDPTSRLLPGSRYTPECLARIGEDRQGYTIFAPLLLAGRKDDVIYARDLHARDTLLLMQYPERAVHLLRPSGTAVGAAPQFYPLRRDSLLVAWRTGE